MIEFWPVLSGKQLLSNQTFRSLFRSETMPESETFQVKDLTYLFTDLKDSTLMYDTVGDLNAYDLVRRHFDALLQAVSDNKGAITKTIGDAIMATFVNPADGVRSAFDMLAAMANFNQAATSDGYKGSFVTGSAYYHDSDQVWYEHRVNITWDNRGMNAAVVSEYRVTIDTPVDCPTDLDEGTY